MTTETTELTETHSALGCDLGCLFLLMLPVIFFGGFALVVVLSRIALSQWGGESGC